MGTFDNRRVLRSILRRPCLAIKGNSMSESGAILIYLVGTSVKFLPRDLHERYTALQWLIGQMDGIGPMFGQVNHLRAYSVEKLPYPIERYTNDAKRLTGKLDRRVGEARFLAGDHYSVADMAVFPWIRSPERRGIDMAEYPNAKRWFDEINARPAVQRGRRVLSDADKPLIQGPWCCAASDYCGQGDFLR